MVRQCQVMNMMANRFPLSRFTGYGISQEAIKNAQYKSLLTGNNNVDFTVNDVSKILDTQSNLSFDLITAFDAIHDQAETGTVLKNIVSLLKPGEGIFLMQDILSSSLLKNNLDHPLGIFLYTIACIHCMSVSLAQDGINLV